MVGMIEGRRRRGCKRMRWLDSITNALNMNLGELQEMVRHREGDLVCCSPWGGKESDRTGWLNNNSNSYNDSLCSAKIGCKSSVSVVTIVIAWWNLVGPREANSDESLGWPLGYRRERGPLFLQGQFCLSKTLHPLAPLSLNCFFCFLFLLYILFLKLLLCIGV